ncbi:MAG: peptide chain release factor 2 [Nitrospirae bacterium GWD2_57_8]|nr:MAG: peptide chain release factor 2 [Nitrospirae bacterium GWD2_57_8]
MRRSSKLRCCGGIFDTPAKEARLAELTRLMEAQGFWDNTEKANEILKEKSGIDRSLQDWQRLNTRLQDLQAMAELVSEEGGQSLLGDLERDLSDAVKDIASAEVAALLSGDLDAVNAIVSIHPGAGGTEAQDWAEMLMRMYLRWSEKTGYRTEILDYQNGEEAGVKSVTFIVTGEYAYGRMKAEAGVHRLVRISPFDTNKRRHTSFASVFVYPEVDDTITIVIDDKELRIDTYRASSAGGQHVNKTDSAVRITHLPTGVVVQCQNERSQLKNKNVAMKVLRSRLYELKKKEQEEKMGKLVSEKKDISWGSQIRSYVFHPYQLVKDHRTGIENGNVTAVMDGGLDEFIEAYLLSMVPDSRAPTT